ncbi:polysaccharide lyase 8 family protein [Nonomuraea sp. NPDC050663]|uniref:polysaccharide lyase 8 family protein n=1 Tax=Nonomuraea sp. NPDC050663 TaxID=3364370 RepID=UPI00378917AB
MISRRTALTLGAATLAGLAAGDAVLPEIRQAGPRVTEHFVALRRRWREVTAVPYGIGVAARYRDSMSPTRDGLWPDQPFPSHVRTPARLVTMARAHALSGEPGLAEAVAAGVEHYRRHVYHRDADQVGNWWHWQIGMPKALLDAATLIGLRDEALAAAVDRFVPARRLLVYSGNSTAANRVDLCTVMLLRSLLTDDHRRAELAASALAPVFRHVDEGDGFHRDGSFIQHTTIPYQGSYGIVLLSGLATLFAVLQGSIWQVDDPMVYEAVERTFAPFVHDGFVMDLVRGRAVDRHPFDDHRKGQELASAILLLGRTAAPEQRERWRGMVKGWLTRSAVEPEARFRPLLEDRSVEALAEPVGHRLFPMSARAVHRRPGWCAALSMASRTIGHYEYGNGENLKGWHTGSGMLYWWADGHGTQYSDRTGMDPYRLPGTTVSTARLPDGAGGAWGDTRAKWRWVGGASDGVRATVGQHLSGLKSSLEAFKSWVFLDDAVICLGAGITCGDGVAVETIVDNRRASGLVVGDGWAHIPGHGGYAAASLKSQESGGYVTLWLDHGVDPENAGYVYALLPGASPARTRLTGWFTVVANTGAQQGVHVPSHGLTAVNFWQPGTVGDLSASAPCAVLVTERGLSVSDPLDEAEELIVTWRGRRFGFSRPGVETTTVLL